MMDGLAERVAVLEEQNDQCSKERDALTKEMTDVNNVLQQIRGSMRTLVVLWTIAVALAGLVGVKYVGAAPAAASAQQH